MDAQQFLAEFGHIANAPGGTVQLRELILCLAMQGKLVPQCLDEPSAATLLEHIELDKKRLIKIGTIKSPKPWPEISQHDMSHALPANWTWVRFGDIAMHNSGKTLDSVRNSGQPRDYITTSNLYWGRFELGNVKKMLIRDEEVEKCTARNNDLLICEGGEAGRAAVWTLDYEVCFQNHVHRARFYGGVNPFFAYRFFEKLNSTGEIAAHRKGIGISNMSSKALAMIPFPLPPTEEQSRIIAKVDELMALCDKLETQQKARRKLQNNLRLSTLQAVAAATSPHELQTTWTRLADNFGQLFHAPEDVSELRLLVKDLAIRGLLTDQENTVHQSDLDLTDLLHERELLRKSKGIRTSRPVILPDQFEEPFPLPHGWKWLSLDQACYQITDGAHHTPNYVVSGVPFLSVKDVSKGIIDFSSTRFITPEAHAELSKRCNPELGDLLLTKVGTTGIAKVVDTNAPFSIFVSLALLKFPHKYIEPLFLELLISSPFVKRQSEEGTRGIGNKNLVLNTIKGFAIPLPPATEQKRILERSEELIRICDSLEAQINHADDFSARLAVATVAALTGIATEQKEEPMKAPQSELIAPLRLGKAPDIKAQSPLATILARHNGEMPAKDLWQRFGGEIDAFYAQLKTEVAHGWILEPVVAEIREKHNETADA